MKNQPFYQTTAKFIAALMIVMLVLGALPATPARAVAKSWVGSAGGVWGTAGNWTPAGVPAAADDVTIPVDQSAAITGVSGTIASLTISGNTILADGPLTVTGALSVASGKTLTLGFATSVGNLTGAGNITTSAAVILTIGTDNTSTTYSGALLAGTGLSLTKAGTGTLTLSGANTYTGVTTINAGVLSVATIGIGGVPSGNLGSATNAATNLVLGGGTLQYTGATAATDRNFTLTAGTTSSINVTTNTLTISGASTNTNGALTKSGVGTLILTSANLYTGLTTVNAGTLQYGANDVLSSGPVTVNDGGTLDLLTYTDTIGALAVNSGSTGGRVTMSTGTLTLDSNVTSTGGAANALISGKLALGATRIFTITDLADGLTVSAVISGAFGVTKAGNGTLTLSSANTYTGTTTINVGTLKLGAAESGGNSVLGTNDAVGTTVAAGAALDLNGFNLGTAEALSLNGTGIALGGALTNSSATSAEYIGLIDLASASSIVTNPGDINISNVGTITGAGSGLTLGGSGNGTLASILGTVGGTLTKNGAGTWTVSGNNTFTGGTTLNAGKLNINHANALGTVAGTFTINGGTIDNTSAGSITTPNYPQAWNGDFTFTGTQDLNLGTGAVTLAGGDRLVTVSAKTLTVGGIVNPNNYSLTKAGAGTLSLGPGNVTLYSLTISAGTLTSSSTLMSLWGNFTNNGTFTHTAGTVSFNGALAQTIGGSAPTTFINLTINNPNGITLGSNITINNQLTLTGGKITTSSYTLILPTTALAVATPSQLSYVYGNVQRAFAGASTFLFPIGGASTYAPVEVTFASASTSGSVTAAVTEAVCGSGSPDINQSKNVHHCWTLTNAVINFGSYIATFNFNGTTDMDAGADPTLFIVGKYDSGAWTTPTPGVITATSTQATGMTTMSSFEVGEPAPVGPVAKFVKGSDTNKAVAAFTLATGVGTAVVNSVVVTGGGTDADLSNIALLGVKLWQDNGTIGEYDGADIQIGTGVSFSGTTATFTSPAITVTTTPTKYLITYDIIASPINAETMSATLVVVNTTPASILSALRYATLTVDSILPTVTNVSSTAANGSYTAGAVIPVTVTFSEAVTVTGTPLLTLETGTTDRAASYISGTGTTILTFNYSVQAGDVSADLDYVATTSLTLNSGTIRDRALNDATLTLPTPGAAGSLGANKAIVIVSALGVTNVTSTIANGTYTTGDVIPVTVTFSQVVNVTGTPQLTLETGTTDRVVNYSSGSGTVTLTFSYTVQAGDTSADLDYAATTSLALNGGTIRNAALTDAILTLPAPAATGSLGANKAIVLSVLAVKNVTSTTADGTYTAGTVIPVTITFNQAVTVTGTPQLTLETGTTDRTVNYTSGTGTATLTFNYTVQSGDTSADLDYKATTSLALNSGTIKNATLTDATLTLPTPGAPRSLGANKAIVIVSTLGVTNVTSTAADGTYTTGAVIPVTVTFSQVVNVTGFPQLTLETGTTDRAASYISGTGTATLTFNYTVQAGDISADLDYVATTSLALNGGTIKNAAGTINATLTLPAPGVAGSLGANKAIVISTLAVTNVSSTAANGTYTTGFVIPVTITFSEAVTVVGTPQLTLETGTTDRVINYSSGTGTVTLTFSYTVQAGDTSADLDYKATTSLVLNGGTIQNAALVNATLTLPAPGAAGSLGYNKALVIVGTTFIDVPTSYWAWDWIERLYHAGVTTGCITTNPMRYCPEENVTRAQMAVFLLRGVHGSAYTPPAVGWSTGFTDVSTSYWAAAWIKQLAAEGITTGCTATTFCPDQPVTRAEMAVFLLRATHGSAYTPPAVGASTGFTDVPISYWAAAWIKQLAVEGITTGCTATTFCPNQSVTRAEMAKFLVAAFNLP